MWHVFYICICILLHKHQHLKLLEFDCNRVLRTTASLREVWTVVSSAYMSNCRQFMYLVISLLVLRAGYGIWLYQFLIIAYLFTSQPSVNNGISVIKSWNNTGPKTEPWGTPDLTIWFVEVTFRSRMHWSRFIRYDLIQFNDVVLNL